ncbi:hypothetical protein ABZ434_29405 [Streptomyces sp. NPDC005761]|uniref:hypothetical protein n=1 Tax=Streptomyces sp. NPDC005761 TaxID=3157066 RepID=UPI0033E8C1AE
MGKSVTPRHTKGYYLTFCAMAELALGLALSQWTGFDGAERLDDFGTEMPGVSWGPLLVAALVITAVAGGLIVFAHTVPRPLRWAVGIVGAASAGALGPIALQLVVRPSAAGVLAAVGIVGMGITMTGLMRAQFVSEPGSRAGRSA